MQAFRRNTLSAIRNAAPMQRRGYAQGASPYSETVQNLRINADTKVLFQGFTGKQGTYVFCSTRLATSSESLTLHFYFSLVSTLSKLSPTVYAHSPRARRLASSILLSLVMGI